MTKISSSLKQRIITGIILAPIVLAITFFASSNNFALLLLVFLVLSAYEWTNLSALHNVFFKAIYIFLLAILFIYLQRIYSIEQLHWLFYISAVWWLFICVMLKTYRATNHRNQVIKLVQGYLTILPAVLAMFFIHQQYGSLMIFYLFMIVWGADIGAYFSGKKFGKRKLAPNLSPGKTIEGVIGGLLLVTILSIVVACFIYADVINMVVFITISIIAACISIVGDLYESLLKREAGVKDSSRLLPGHGGVLDRIDSLLAAAPIFLLLYSLFLKG